MDVKSIAVIGAGTLGKGIALAAVLAGYRTILEDLMPEKLEAAQGWIERSLDADIARGAISSHAGGEAFRRISTVRTVEDACREADMLIEAVPEEMELKLELFTFFDKFAKPRAVMASSTPSLSIAEMAAMTYRPEFCAGMRFLHPVSARKLLEIVRARETSDETVAACREAGRRMGREVTVVCESPEGIPGPGDSDDSHARRGGEKA